jgi:amino acid adenylation domain-containing protein
LDRLVPDNASQRFVTLSEVEQHQLAAWNETTEIYPHDLLIPQLIARQARLVPDATAVVDGNNRMNYAELNHHANQLAHHLLSLGAQPGTIIGLCVERSCDLVVGLLGILKASSAYLPIDTTFPTERITFMLADSQAQIVVTQQAFADKFSGVTSCLICLDADAGILASLPIHDPACAAMPDDLAYVVYTSGSTGRPKGVMITHKSVLNLAYWHRHAFGITTSDRASQLASPAFDAAGWELWPYLSAGASVFVVDEDTRFSAILLRDWLIANQITVSFLPTSLAERIIELEWPAHVVLRYLLTGADTLHAYPPPSLPFSLVNNYGPSEATVLVTSAVIPPNPQADTPPPLGRAIANTQIYLLDEHLYPVPIGVTGEICIGGVGLARGYLHRPDLTGERFVPNPFAVAPGERLYRTGDLARFLPDGQLAFAGRIDNQIKIRGYRIEPDEISSVLNQQPVIQASIVVSREETRDEKYLVAYVVPVPGMALSPGDLRAALATHLPDYMIPAIFVQLDAMPTTPNGKIDRRQLPVPDAMNTLRDGDISVPTSPIEERVVVLVALLLNLPAEDVGIDDNFFLMGGHSLLGTQLIARIFEAFGVELTLRTIFDAPTVRQLAAEIEQRIIAKIEAMSDDEAQRLLR